MKVYELIERLEEWEPDSEVYIATQPSWPLQFEVARITSNEDQLPNPDEPDVVYLLTGEHPGGHPYAPRDLW